MNSRRKGAEGERELAKYLRERGYEARRGQQYCGANGDADVEGLDGIHIECKRVEHLNIEKALAQSTRDAYADSLKQGKTVIPVVFHRQNNTKWKVTLGADDFLKMYEGMKNGKKDSDIRKLL